MAEKRELALNFNLSIPEMLNKAETIYTLGLERQSILVTANTLLIPTWFTTMRAKLDVLQALPKIAERRQEGVEATGIRNVTLKEGKGLIKAINLAVNQAKLPGDPFGQKGYVAATKSPVKLLDFLKAVARQAVSDKYKAKLLAAGLPQDKLDRLAELVPEAQEEQTEHVVTDQGGTSVSAEHVLLYNAFWTDYIRVIRDASLVAEWPNPADVHLFRLYDNVPERRFYTLKPEELKAKRLEHEIHSDRVLSFTVEDPGLEAALVDNPEAMPAAWLTLEPTLAREPRKVKAFELGAGQYLVVKNRATETAALAVTVIPG